MQQYGQKAGTSKMEVLRSNYLLSTGDTFKDKYNKVLKGKRHRMQTVRKKEPECQQKHQTNFKARIIMRQTQTLYNDRRVNLAQRCDNYNIRS